MKIRNLAVLDQSAITITLSSFFSTQYPGYLPDSIWWLSIRGGTYSVILSVARAITVPPHRGESIAINMASNHSPFDYPSEHTTPQSKEDIILALWHFLSCWNYGISSLWSSDWVSDNSLLIRKPSIWINEDQSAVMNIVSSVLSTVYSGYVPGTVSAVTGFGST